MQKGMRFYGRSRIQLAELDGKKNIGPYINNTRRANWTIDGIGNGVNEARGGVPDA